MKDSNFILRFGRRICSIPIVLLPLAACDQPSDGNPEATGEERSLQHAHASEGETCFICDPARRDPERLWCQEHARYEDRCWLCQPQLRDAGRAYCEEHGLYEDECFLCDPGRAPAVDDGGESETASAGELYCREHRVMERDCGICQPQFAATLQPGESLKVRFKSSSSASKAGIKTSRPRLSESRPSFRAFCEVRYNANRLAHITPLAPGIVRRVFTDVGAEVRRGDVLAEIHSAEIAAAKMAFVSATVDHRLKEKAWKREEALLEKRITAERELQEAEAACKLAELTLKATRQKLLNFGLTDAQVNEIAAHDDGSAIFEIRAPYDATVVERDAVVGEAVEPGATLVTLADLSEMWIDLSVPGNHVAVLEEGLEVEVGFSDIPGLTVTGAIDWVDSSIDEKSRMVKARAMVPNGDRKLKAGMFGNARILLPARSRALRLPKSSLQKLETRPYVFVKLESDLYALRRVLLGSGTDRSVDVLQGIQPDDEVVVEGAFTVMSEFLKSRLGAGCVDE